jgi:hypothetical protein
VEFAVAELALEQVFLRALRFFFSPVRVVQPLFSIYI